LDCRPREGIGWTSGRAAQLDLLAALPDDLLLERVHTLVTRERSATAELVAHLSEMDLRRLYLGRGCSSMFTYCTERLHLSESAAYDRIEVARAVRRLPRLLPSLADGSLSLTAIRRLAMVLTAENFDRLISEARHRTTREIGELVAREQPRPDAPSRIRRLPAPRRDLQLVLKRVETDPLSPSETPAESVESVAAVASGGPSTDRSVERDRASIEPLAPERYRVQFTAGAEMRGRIQRLQNLLRHRIPDGDIATVIDTAVIELLAKVERRKFGASSNRRAHGRR